VISPRFSVVVPAYNAAATIDACVMSVLRQTERDLELIVVDDGSTDVTAGRVAAVTDPRVVLHRQSNRGLAAARNAGTERASGEFVAFLDSDDLLLPSYLSRVRETLERDPGLDFVYSDAWTFDDLSRRVRRHTTAHYQRPPRPAPATAAGLLRELVLRNFIIIPVAVRRSVLLRHGGFDETMTSAEDWDMWLRLTAAGHRGAEAPGPNGLRREHGAQMSADHIRMFQNLSHALENLIAHSDLAADDLALVDRRLRSVEHELRILTGQDRPRAALRRLRWRLGALRRAAGLGARWYDVPPEPVRHAFGDLKSLDEVRAPSASQPRPRG
jgi:glycosyltransferase involved in cell wall biosynthesis